MYVLLRTVHRWFFVFHINSILKEERMKKCLAGAVMVVAGLFMLSASTVSAQDFCKGDFNYNGSVAAEDVTEFLNHFGRNPFNNPCPPDGPAPVA